MSHHQTKMLQVKLSLALLSSSAVLGAFSGSAEDILPPRFNFDRYTPMVNHSPFAVATAVALPEATPDFARDLYIANAARSPGGDMVTIRSSSDQNFKKYLSTREPVDGYSIAQIEWSEDVGKTKVTISKDGKFATLTFNQALLSQGARAGAPTGAEMRPGVPLIPSPGGDQASRARMRREIQRDTGLDAKPVPGFVPREVPIPEEQQPMQRPQQPRRSGEKDQPPPS